jgi:hypothetical protein
MPAQRRASTAKEELQRVEADWKRGLVKDPTDAMIRIERIRLASNEHATDTWPTLFPLSLFVGLPFLGYVYVYFAPPYNFLWGDYIVLYEKRRSKGRFLLIGIVLTLLLVVNHLKT